MNSIYRLMQLIFSTLLKGIIRKECQSFTNHGHDKTPPTVFNPLSPWLTLPRDMGVSHTLWPPSIARAILACLWFAQYDVQVILCIQFYRLTQLIFSTLLNAYLFLTLSQPIFVEILKKKSKKVWRTRKKCYLCSPFRK